MKRFIKDFSSCSYNIEEIVKLIPIDDLASHFVHLTKLDETTFRAGLQDWNMMKDQKHFLFINIENQKFTYNEIEGNAADLFSFLCPKGNFFAFIEKVYHINKNRYIKEFTFTDGTVINVNEYPIKDITLYISDWME